MPIDIRLLRTPDDTARVSHWQTLRNPDQQDDDIAVMVAQQLDQANRQALKTLSSYKSKCRQERQRPDPQQLQSYQQDCSVCQQQLEQALCEVGNAVDETLLTEMEMYAAENDSDTSESKKRLLRSPFRHLLEVEAFECGTSSHNNNALQLQSGSFYPTGIGMDWARALSCDYWAAFTAENTINRLELPMSLPLSAQHLHDMMGCAKKNQTQVISACGENDNACQICAATTANAAATPEQALLQAPSWMGYLKDRYGDQTLGDKQLPLTLCYQTTTVATTPAVSFDVLVDTREQWRCDSWHSLLPSNIPTANINYQVLILTSATYYDSRTVQKEWADKMVSFYTSLLLLSKSAGQQETLVRQRVVSPPQLLPAEASRIVIEGYLPPSSSSGINNVGDNNSSNDEGRWVILAYLSNFSDFATRACRIKNNPQQFCHVLQGMVCSTLEVMCWQASLANGDKNDQVTGGEFGVRLPATLASHLPPTSSYNKTMEEDGSVLLPRRKVFEKNKHGRLQPKPAGQSGGKKQNIMSQNAVAHSQTAAKMPKHDTRGGGQSNKSGEKDSNRAPLLDTDAVLLSSSASPTRATVERIRAEALSSPFGFLPFYSS